MEIVVLFGEENTRNEETSAIVALSNKDCNLDRNNDQVENSSRVVRS